MTVPQRAFVTSLPLSSRNVQHTLRHHTRRNLGQDTLCPIPQTLGAVPLRQRQRRATRYHPISCTSTEAVATESEDADSPKVAGTPCFTKRILSSPMPRSDRQVYLDNVTASVDAFLTSFKEGNPSVTMPPVAQATLLAPQLNPSLDIYDRRFLLQLTWAAIASTARTHSLRTRVLIQGRRAFGAIPLSVAGLRRHFDGDLEASITEWPDTVVRSGDLEDVNDLDDSDEAIIVVSPTNAVSIPIISSVMDVVERAKGRPVLLLNPRLDDVPSHSGVMQVSGRAGRIAFLKTIQDVFYLRLLYDPGSSYPPRGILYQSWPQKWQVWRSEDIDVSYSLISETDEQPNPSQISDAYVVDSYKHQKQLSKESTEHLTSIDVFLKPRFAIPIMVVALLILSKYVMPLLSSFTIPVASLS